MITNNLKLFFYFMYFSHVRETIAIVSGLTLRFVVLGFRTGLILGAGLAQW